MFHHSVVKGHLARGVWQYKAHRALTPSLSFGSPLPSSGCPPLDPPPLMIVYCLAWVGQWFFLMAVVGPTFHPPFTFSSVGIPALMGHLAVVCTTGLLPAGPHAHLMPSEPSCWPRSPHIPTLWPSLLLRSPHILSNSPLHGLFFLQS